MNAVIQCFLLMPAAATDRELAKQVQFLKVENQILRGRLSNRITVTPLVRRRLIKDRRPLGKAIKEGQAEGRHANANGGGVGCAWSASRSHLR